MIRILLVGHGKMGRMIEALAREYECEVAGIIDPLSPAHGGNADDGRWHGVDVAVDFTSPDAVMANAMVLAKRGINLVIGTTGWTSHEPELQRIAADARIGVVVAPNFSAGVVLFEAVAAHTARLFAPQQQFGAFLHEAHHAAKKDAPSGTALSLKRAMEDAGFGRAIDVSSTRAGFIPGTHTIGFDGPAETLTLTHTARDRSAFAHGALTAVRWVHGKRGWFTMKDVLGIEQV